MHRHPSIHSCLSIRQSGVITFKSNRKSVEGLEFCERCGSICDKACRANAALEQSRLSVLQHGVRI